MQTSQYKAYSIATHTAPKTRQVVMLYDGAIRFIRQAKDAIMEKRIEDRFKLLLRASQIIVGLRGSIDYEQGGEVAHTLERFYTGIDVRILSINFAKKDGEALCEAIIADLKAMREVWENIDRTLHTPETDNAATTVAAAHMANGLPGVTLSA